MKNLIVIGARGAGRETVELARLCTEFGVEWNIKGFLDDQKDALDGISGFPPILDSVENYTPHEDDVFVCPLGNPVYKKKYAEMIEAKGGQFVNVIHPAAKPNDKVILGKGIIIHAHTTISPNVRIGNMVTLQSHHVIGHDAEVGDYCQLGALAFIGGYSKLGDCVLVGPGAIIIDRLKIGDGANVGPGAVVIKNVKEHTTVFGSPARPVSA